MRPARRGPPVSTTPIYLGGRADRVQLAEDPRARQMLRALAAHYGMNMSKLMRKLLFDRYLEVFVNVPKGESRDEPQPKDKGRRAYQDAYSKAWRASIADGETKAQARRAGRAAGRGAATARREGAY